MAEKLLNTRIALRIDTFENWSKTGVAGQGAKLVLKRGEIGLCEIPSGNAAAQTAPTVLFKVGDGTTPFGELKWASALAADVYSWAKASEKPIYKWDEITEKPTEFNAAAHTHTPAEVGLGNVRNVEQYSKGEVDNLVAEIRGLAEAEFNTTYQLIQSGTSLTLQSKENTEGAEWVDVDTVDLATILESTFVKQESGKGLSSEDFTAELKTKLTDDYTKAEIDELLAGKEGTHEHPYINISEKGAASGVATLDENSKLLVAQLPEGSVVDAQYATRMSDVEAGVAGIEGKVNSGVTEAKGYTDSEIAKEVTRSNGAYDAIGSASAAEAAAKLYASEQVSALKTELLGPGATEAMDTINELAAALKDHEDEYDALLEVVGAKATTESVNAELAKKADKTELHSHDNKAILDGITASFTTELKEKLEGIEAGANKYELPSDVVQDSNYQHVTVTENSVSAGNVTFNKYDDTALAARVKELEDNPYALPEDVVQDANYATRMAAVEEGVADVQNKVNAGVESANGYTDAEIAKVVDGTYVAKKAEQDAAGNVIVDTYATKTELSGVEDKVEAIEAKKVVEYYEAEDNTHNTVDNPCFVFYCGSASDLL